MEMQETQIMQVTQEMFDQAAQHAFIMLSELDFFEEFQLLQVKRFHIMKRKILTREFNALYLALWRFALLRSFPNNSQEIYDTFLTLSPSWLEKNKDKNLILETAELYYEKLGERGLEDFSEIARHILSFVQYKEDKMKAFQLRLTLIIRSRYSFFFEHLI